MRGKTSIRIILIALLLFPRAVWAQELPADGQDAATSTTGSTAETTASTTETTASTTETTEAAADQETSVVGEPSSEQPSSSPPLGEEVGGGPPTTTPTGPPVESAGNSSTTAPGQVDPTEQGQVDEPDPGDEFVFMGDRQEPILGTDNEVLTSTLAISAFEAEPGFSVTPAIVGVNRPVTVAFAGDGRIFVAEKAGIVKIFNGLGDASADTLVNLSGAVYEFWDRGLLGMAVHPNFPTNPFLYVLYTWDTVPYNDGCPSVPGATNDGCMANARLSRLQVGSSNNLVGAEQVLLQGNWCQQYPSHSIGSLRFGADGALYVSAGDGASFTFVDYGHGGGDSGSPTPENPCGDPPVAIGGDQSPPTAQGGALRSQDLRTTGDPVTFDGSVLRVDPNTGAALTSNPLIGGDTGDDRTVAYGLRNPFRFTVRPGTSELWIGDVGWNEWEEINRVPAPTSAPIRNFGWPCYEGNGRQPGYDSANLSVCENLYSQGGQTAPYFTYRHGVAMDNCPEQPGSVSAITGLAFYQSGPYPAEYDGALFFSDYSRQCIWVMFAGAGGLPDPATVQLFSTQTPAVDLVAGPSGDVFFPDLLGNTIYRISFPGGNGVPVAVAAATPTSGEAPLDVSFDGSGSSDPDSDPLSYAWDLDGDGSLDDSTSVSPAWTYTQAANVTVTLQVSDGQGGTDTDQITISVTSGPNTAPVATISSPTGAILWKVGDTIGFSGSATDAEDGTLPASSLSWSLVLHHCAPDVPTDCHQHPLQTFSGVASGSFAAPDHEYPSHLELILTAVDSGGTPDTANVLLQPETIDLTFHSDPSGLQLVLGSTSRATPFTRTVIVGSINTISAPSPQALGGDTYEFSSWSDGGGRIHEITAPASDLTLTATFHPAATEANGYMEFSGSVGTYGSTPDAAGLDVTGDLDLRADVAANDWTPSFFIKLISKLDGTGGYELLQNSSTGGLRLAWRNSTGGLSARNSTAAVPMADGERIQVRATLDVNNGAGGHTATFYYRTDTSLDLESNQGWTQLGSPVATGGITSIGANGTQLVLGADSDGIGNHFAGRYHQALVSAGFNPPTGLGADPDFRTTTQLISSPPDYSQWRDSVNNTWTLNGSGWSYTPG